MLTALKSEAFKHGNYRSYHISAQRANSLSAEGKIRICKAVKAPRKKRNAHTESFARTHCTVTDDCVVILYRLSLHHHESTLSCCFEKVSTFIGFTSQCLRSLDNSVIKRSCPVLFFAVVCQLFKCFEPVKNLISIEPSFGLFISETKNKSICSSCSLDGFSIYKSDTASEILPKASLL